MSEAELQKKVVEYEALIRDLTDALRAQRTWVGLTDEEINELWAKTGNIVGFGGLMFETIRAVEAKLKEKNT